MNNPRWEEIKALSVQPRTIVPCRKMKTGTWANPHHNRVERRREGITHRQQKKARVAANWKAFLDEVMPLANALGVM